MRTRDRIVRSRAFADLVRGHAGTASRSTARSTRIRQNAPSNRAVLRSLRQGIVPSSLIPEHRSSIGNRRFQRLVGNVVVPADAPSAQPKEATSGESSPTGLTSPRFIGDPLLEDCFFGRARLKKGMKGESVKTVQQALIDLQFDLGPTGADGDFGSRTEAAVKSFKSQQELAAPQSGDVGPSVMRRLDELFPAAPPEPGPVFNPELEDKLDVVWLEYASLFQEQHDIL